MRFGKAMMAAAVATSLISTPVLAGAENLSVASAQRDAAPVGQQEELAGGNMIVALIGLVLVVAAVVIAFDDNNEDSPTSP